MRRAFRQVAAGFVGGVLAGVVLFPATIALAEERAEDLHPSDEAFFLRHRDPMEPVPPGGGVGLPDDATEIPRATVRDQTNPYGTETIHVGVNAGQEEAIAYIGLTGTRDELGFVEITGGEIRLPISGFGQSNRNPEGADMVACMATDLVVDAHGGSWDSQYEYDCGTLAEVVLEEGSDPLTWVIDLAPFVPAWQDVTVPPGIAIVPNPETEQSPPEQTWHVSWQNRHYLPEDNDDPDPRPITVALSYIEDEDAFPDFGDPDTTATTTGQDFAAPPPATGPTQQFGAQSGFAPPPPTETPDFAGDADAEFAPPEEMDEDEAVAAPPGADFDPAAIRTNPAVYLLPFLAVGLAGLVGYSLTSEPVLPHAREGAVTNLMRRRRAAAAAAAGADNV